MAASDEDRQSENAGIVPSDLDEKTHAEMLLLYQDSAHSLRHARDRQWKLVGGILLLFVIIMALPEIYSITAFAARGLVLASLLISAATIYILVIYQVSLGADLGRLQTIGDQFSSIFVDLWGRRARRDAKSYGYIILVLMIFAVLLGNAVVVVVLAHLYR